jgi:predicted transposase/invertase (TIGR01784 family)
MVIAVGLAEGTAKSKVEIAKSKAEIAKKMKAKNMPLSDIIELTGLTQEEVEQL